MFEINLWLTIWKWRYFSWPFTHSLQHDVKRKTLIKFFVYAKCTNYAVHLLGSHILDLCLFSGPSDGGALWVRCDREGALVNLSKSKKTNPQFLSLRNVFIVIFELVIALPIQLPLPITIIAEASLNCMGHGQ